MSLRQLGAQSKKAFPGDELLVVHDFEARSPDELSLYKGDRIELIERDDDFGDGWYLGKHLQNGRTGLFPEVYTTNTPRPINISAANTKRAPNNATDIHVEEPGSGGINAQSATPPPLNTVPSYKGTTVPASVPAAALNGSSNVDWPIPKSISMVQQRTNEDSPVMNETLSVIDEHITDMNMLPRSMAREDEHLNVSNVGNDSGSDYSSHMDHRLSYIAGHETDEEERNVHTEKEVSLWTPAQVAEHLEDIGVEYGHCEIFKEQEINGEVLLAMDQASIFMKEFNLGLVGQRLRTWHKIKALQEEIREADTAKKASQRTSKAKVTSPNAFEPPRRSATGPSVPSTSSFANQFEIGPTYLQQATPSPQPSPSPSGHTRHASRPDAISRPTSFNFQSGMDSPGRPSAASIRDLNHSRRHSAADFGAANGSQTPTDPNTPQMSENLSTPPSHKKAPSLDRNWTMGPSPKLPNGRPKSAVNTGTKPVTDPIPFDPATPSIAIAFPGSRDIDRGYVSGGEAETRKPRNVLRKRGDTVSASHSRQSSYQDGNKRISFAGAKRHSRFGSVDSIKDTVAAMTAPAAKIYHANGAGIKSHFRNSSANDAVAPGSSPSDLTPPTVTKLEYDDKKKPSMKIITTNNSTKNGPGSSGSPKSATTPRSGGAKPRIGLRAISDAVTGNERAVAQSPPASVPSPVKESARHSPTRTGSTTPSGASQNLDRESTDASSKGTSGVHTGLTPTSATRRKTKKETSAYIRGLEAKTPHDQMIGCDYSGWMKKKSSSIMTTWKPRLFVLRGRRLSYYYTEQDTQEKGLIDISSHRVLPADGDIITGIHASVMGAKSGPVSPATAQTPTMASKDAAAQPESTLQKPSDSTFIFKLVPPRSGLSRAVNFTKPTIHYFAVDNVRQGRLWMAALMKATIDRDETKPIETTYRQSTISLTKARAMRHRPPALMGLDETTEGMGEGPKSDETGLNIQGLDLGEKESAKSEHKRAGSLDGGASLSTTETLGQQPPAYAAQETEKQETQNQETKKPETEQPKVTE